MKWRVVEDRRSNVPLPGPAGELSITLVDRQIMVVFASEDGITTMYAAGVDVSDRRRLTVSLYGEHVVFAPAQGLKRRRVPVPPPPKLDEVTAGYCETRRVHRVAKVDKVPDPNRAWNQKDALIEARCGYQGWIRPDHMTALPDVARCDAGCYREPPDPRSSRLLKGSRTK